MHRPTPIAGWINAGILIIHLLGVGTLHTQPGEDKEPVSDTTRSENVFSRMDATKLDAPIIILEENHAIGTPRDQLVQSPLASGRIVVLEMLDSAQAQSVRAYLDSESDTLAAGLNHLLRSFSREADASEADHSYARLIGQARQSGTRIEGIYCHEEPKGEFWGGAKWWAHRIELKDRIYAKRLYEAYQKDSLPRLFLVGGQHGEGVSRWLEAHGVRTTRVVAWDSIQSPRWRQENPSAGRRDSAYVERTQHALDSIALSSGFWRAPQNYPADGVWVTKDQKSLRPPMPPIQPNGRVGCRRTTNGCPNGGSGRDTLRRTGERINPRVFR